MKKKKRVDITAYRKRMGDFDKGFTLKEHREIDKDRKGDWDQEDIMRCPACGTEMETWKDEQECPFCGLTETDIDA